MWAAWPPPLHQRIPGRSVCQFVPESRSSLGWRGSAFFTIVSASEPRRRSYGWMPSVKAKGPDMNTAASSLAAISPASRALQLGLVALLGAFIVGFLGFSHMEVVHN